MVIQVTSCLASCSKNIMTRNQQLRFHFFSPDLIVRSFSICIFVSEAHLETYKPSLLGKCMELEKICFLVPYKQTFFSFSQVINGLELLELWSKSITEILEKFLLARILEVFVKLSIKFLQKLRNLVIL